MGRAPGWLLNRCGDDPSIYGNVGFESGRVRSAPAPGDRCPDALMKVIPPDLGDELQPGDQACELELARQVPADHEGVERSQGPPANGFDDRPCVRLCSAE